MKHKILVIEDDSSSRYVIKSMLRSKYDVVLASDGEEGIYKYYATNPDLVICDITMPKMNGYEVLEFLNKKELLTNTPFIFLTARGEYNDLRKGMCIGADDYLTKPCNTGDLLTSIEIRLEKFKRREKLANVTLAESEVRSKKIKINNGNNSIYLDVEKIICILAERQYSRVIWDGGKDYLIKRALNKWIELLPQEKFIRVHRSTIINLRFVEELAIRNRITKLVYLKGLDNGIEISRRYFKLIKESIAIQ